MKVSIDEKHVELLIRYSEIIDKVRPMLEQNCRSYGFGGEFNKCREILRMILEAAECRQVGASEEYPESVRICKSWDKANDIPDRMRSMPERED